MKEGPILITADITQKKNELINKCKQSLNSIDYDYVFSTNKDAAISLVFVGQYSAGKSTIIKMLTGIEDIEIGAGITTQSTHTYSWNGMRIVDTPGIHSEQRKDHDEITYEAIASADILVYVVTNELFDSHIADHFRKLAIDQGKADEMVLVVNKMSRTTNGNTPDQQEIIKKDLEKVLSPYLPEDLNICFLDAESYVESMEEDDEEIKNELIERSGFYSFVNALDMVASKKGVASRMTTDLYEMQSLLQKALQELDVKSNDENVDDLEENYSRKLYSLASRKAQIEREIKALYSASAGKIRQLGATSAEMINSELGENTQSLLEANVRKVDEICDDCNLEATQRMNKTLSEIGNEIDKVDGENFSMNLKIELEKKYGNSTDWFTRLMSKSGGTIQTAGKKLTEKARNHAGTGFELLDFNGSDVHELVTEVGHAFGHKFKPWEAVKITQKLAYAGEAMGVLGSIYDSYTQIKGLIDEEKRKEQLKNTRRLIRAQFNEAADRLEQYGIGEVKNRISDPLSDYIEVITGYLSEIRELKESDNNSHKKISNLLNECQHLINDIHNSFNEIETMA